MPAAPEAYIERTEPLIWLESLVSQNVRLITIEGMAGAGKTELLFAFGRRMETLFKGRVYCQKVGLEAEGRIVLAHLVAEVGQADYPQELQVDDAGRYLHEALADKPALILMDDVWSAHVCRAITEALPTSSRLVITTRNSQMVDRLGVPASQRLQIQGMSEQEGMTLCRQLARQEWDEANESLALWIGQRVHWHPKALTLLTPVGQRIGWQALRASFGQQVEIAEARGALTWDEEINLALEASYEYLGERKVWLDALGKLDWCSSFGCEVMAAVWNMDENIAVQRIGELVGLHWIEQAQEAGWPGARYGLHWLVWSYARGHVRWGLGERIWGPAWVWRYKSAWLNEQLAWPRLTRLGWWRRLIRIIDLRHWPVPKRPGVNWFQGLRASASGVLLQHWLRNGIEMPGEVYVLTRRLDIRAKLLAVSMVLGAVVMWMMVVLGVHGAVWTVLGVPAILLVIMMLYHFAMVLRFLERYGPG